VTTPAWHQRPENSLDEFLRYLDARLPGTAQVYFSEDRQSFRAGVEAAVDASIRSMERSAKFHHGRGELELSKTLCDLLERAAIPCVAEGYSNGHVDVTVTHPRVARFVVLGECKMWNGQARHRAACAQLLDRYATGREAGGFVLEFVGVRGMYRLLSELRSSLGIERPPSMVSGPKNHPDIEGGFHTTHEHHTGALVVVFHIGCNVFHPSHEGTTTKL